MNPPDALPGEPVNVEICAVAGEVCIGIEARDLSLRLAPEVALTLAQQLIHFAAVAKDQEARTRNLIGG